MTQGHMELTLNFYEHIPSSITWLSRNKVGEEYQLLENSRKYPKES